MPRIFHEMQGPMWMHTPRGDPRVLAYPIAVTVMPGQALIEQIGPVPWQVPAPKARPS